MKNKDAKANSDKEKGDYIIRLLDPNRARCIFCLKEIPFFNMTEDDLQGCCGSFDKDAPLGWAAKNKNFWIYIDWINFSACNSMFCSYIELDSLSRRVEEQRLSEFINLEECIRLHNQKEKVEMECDKCK